MTEADAPDPGADVDWTRICWSCAKELPPGAGRYLFGVYAVCADCYDAGVRGRTEPKA